MSRNEPEFIIPDWPAPPNVKALATTRRSGFSGAPFDSLNLGTHVGDDAQTVARNRASLRRHLPTEPLWLNQVHGTVVADASQTPAGSDADAAVAHAPGAVCAVMTADCLPVLFCDETGTVAGAAHAGWRGLCNGVLEATVAAMTVAPERILAWLGPAIGPQAFEVGNEVRAAFVARDAHAADAFRPGAAEGKWLADLYQLARQRLEACGVTRIYGGEYCTFSEPARFFSYRRDGQTGRMASLIWLENPSSSRPENRSTG
ncbi:conserved hypothetical protein [Formivibrio citricus]|uniref:Purine nucleoside phosphorylase n=1 Tax=Formivibrio citricus TaxID=83765 RepID=A0A1I5ATT2_9NEIS|nr:peptidoglycan editing factor PgeF [Formivibrio citricus]SFN65609.1 conserved hypothetical protein [Formivibrio citricus]